MCSTTMDAGECFQTLDSRLSLPGVALPAAGHRWGVPLTLLPLSPPPGSENTHTHLKHRGTNAPPANIDITRTCNKTFGDYYHIVCMLTNL